MPGGGSTGPDGNVFNHLSILPVTDHYFPVDSHPGHDKPMLTVSVSRLIKVHEIHVNIAPGKIPVELCVQVKNRLLELLQSVDPHLGGGERVAPGN